MTRTEKSGSRRSGAVSKSNSAERRSQVSRALTKLLRHQAQNEKVPITRDGWVKLDDILAWSGMGQKRFNPAVTLDEIFEVVEDDGIHGKGRFGVRLQETTNRTASSTVATVDGDGAATGGSVDAEASHEPEDAGRNANADAPDTQSSKNSPETMAALQYHELHPTTPASAYLIRATQGHSIKAVESEGLHTLVTLDDPSSIPDTVVHGTFYGAWDLIVRSGGLKPMSRNLVHFGTGPRLSEVLPDSAADESSISISDRTTTLKSKADVDAVLTKNKVISGMRWDAQILIYIDLKRLLNDVKEQGWDMKWYRSNNGVILTEGVVIPEPESTGNDEPEELQKQALDGLPETTFPAQAGTKASDSIATLTNSTANTETDLPSQPPTDGPEQADPTRETDAESRELHKETKRQLKLQPRPKNESSSHFLQTRKPSKPPPHPHPHLRAPQPLVPLAYFSHVVEIKSGLGLLYSHERGEIQKLPENLRTRALPHGKGNHMARRGGGRVNQGSNRSGEEGKRGGKGKPGLRVERDDIVGDLEGGN